VREAQVDDIGVVIVTDGGASEREGMGDASVGNDHRIAMQDGQVEHTAKLTGAGSLLLVLQQGFVDGTNRLPQASSDGAWGGEIGIG